MSLLGLHDPKAVARLLKDGAMPHITSLSETWKPLATLAAQLEAAGDTD